MAKNPELVVGSFCFFLIFPLIILTTTDFASAITMDTASSFGDNNYGSILSQLGFHRFASAVPSFLNESLAFATWNGPFTIFAPPDESAPGLSNPEELGRYIIPGLFTSSDGRTLMFSSKLETMSPGHCLNIIGSDIPINEDGPQIIHPDMFNNGFVAVHGLNEPLQHSSSLRSCSFDSITMSFPLPWLSDQIAYDPLMKSMLRDAILRLGITGYGILALAMKDLYPELVNLQNATVFAIPDESIFSGSIPRYPYVSNVKHHIVPNHYLETHDLKKLPFGEVLPTLNSNLSNQFLVVTKMSYETPVSINTQRIKKYEVIKNLKIVVHTLHSPFPYIS